MIAARARTGSRGIRGFDDRGCLLWMTFLAEAPLLSVRWELTSDRASSQPAKHRVEDKDVSDDEKNDCLFGEAGVRGDHLLVV